MFYIMFYSLTCIIHINNYIILTRIPTRLIVIPFNNNRNNAMT